MRSAKDAAANRKTSALDVVFIHPAADKRAGGIVNAGLSYVRGLEARGHRVEVWTGSPVLAARAAGIGLAVVLNAGLRTWFDTMRSRPLRRAIFEAKRRGVDAFVHNTGHLWPLVWPVLGARRQFVVFHNDKIAGRGYFPNWLAISSTQHARLSVAAKRRPWVRTIAQIKNGLLLPAKTTRPEPMREETIFGALAVFRHEKGMDLLVQAAVRMRRAGAKFRFRVGGDGPEFEAVKAMAQAQGVADRFDWLGWVDDVDSFYAGVDVFCLPSRNEPFGLVVVEAMARGVPVVACRTHGPVDIMRGDTMLGWLVDIDDADAFAAALLEAIGDPNRRSTIARAAERHVAGTYSDLEVGIALESALRHGLEPIVG